MLTPSLLIVLSALALAQETPSAEAPPAEPAVEAPVPAAAAPAPAEPVPLVELVAGLDGVLLDAASALLDDDQAAAARAQAAGVLAEHADPRTLPLLRVALLRGGPVAVRQAAAEALIAFDDPRAQAVLLQVAQSPAEPEALRVSAVRAVAVRAAAADWDALYTLAQDRDTPSTVRAAVVEELRARNPAILAQRGVPQATGLDLYAVPAIVANGVAGGVLFSAIGTLGQSEAGEVIGAVGGSLIGLGTGTTYALTQPLSFGQSLQWTTGVAGGLNAGVLVSEAAGLGQEGAAVSRALGTLGGAGLGWWHMRSDPTPGDVIERAVVGTVTEIWAYNVYDLIDPPNYVEYRPREWEARQQRQTWAAAGGLAAGVIAGNLLGERWVLEPQDAVFSGVVGVELGVAGSLFTVTALNGYHEGAFGTAWGAGTLGALALAELRPASLKRSFYMGYGAAAGHAVGAGAVWLAQSWDADDALVAGATMGGGLGGAALGYALGDRLSPTPGDYALLYIGVPLWAAHMGALNGALAQDFEHLDSPGLALLGGGAGALGLVALGEVLDPRPAQVAVVGSAAAWGAWYGVLTPVAMGLEGEPNGLIYAGIGTADAFIAGAVLAQSPLVGLEPRQTLIPQLCGVGGATLGSLGAALFTSDTQAIAAGALGGSTLGFGAGVLVEVLRGDRPQAEALLLPRPRWTPRLPGQWSASALPILTEEGWGAQASVQVVGW